MNFISQSMGQTAHLVYFCTPTISELYANANANANAHAYVFMHGPFSLLGFGC